MPKKAGPKGKKAAPAPKAPAKPKLSLKEALLKKSLSVQARLEEVEAKEKKKEQTRVTKEVNEYFKVQKADKQVIISCFTLYSHILNRIQLL